VAHGPTRQAGFAKPSPFCVLADFNAPALRDERDHPLG